MNKCKVHWGNKQKQEAIKKPQNQCRCHKANGLESKGKPGAGEGRVARCSTDPQAVASPEVGGPVPHFETEATAGISEHAPDG